MQKKPPVKLPPEYQRRGSKLYNGHIYRINTCRAQLYVNRDPIPKIRINTANIMQHINAWQQPTLDLRN